MTKTASSSRVFLSDAELVQVLETLDSDFSDISDCDDALYIPEDSGDSEIGENYSIAVLQPPKRNRTSSDLFQWRSGNFIPTVHNFNSENSGISVNAGLSDDSKVFS
ncbi:hypothetical protein L9F63_014333 [Diploptera punctata]|uniref:Uncharacterized protein n=1 Tax=Diploptera punctata TaxID=6984 RepID=A0AAD8A872_DIPPU|nr:hypothetical protein L9F63_014333 [Diploptera punctata]